MENGIVARERKKAVIADGPLICDFIILEKFVLVRIVRNLFNCSEPVATVNMSRGELNKKGMRPASACT